MVQPMTSSGQLLQEMTAIAKDVKENNKWLATDGQGRVYTKKKHCKFVRLILSFFNLLSGGKIYRSIRCNRVATALHVHCDVNKSFLTDEVKQKVFEILDHLHGKAKKTKNQNCLQMARNFIAKIPVLNTEARVLLDTYSEALRSSAAADAEVEKRTQALDDDTASSPLPPAYLSTVALNNQSAQERQALQLRQQLQTMGLVTPEDSEMSGAALLRVIAGRHAPASLTMEQQTASSLSPEGALLEDITVVDSSAPAALTPAEAEKINRTIVQMEAGLTALVELTEKVDQSASEVSKRQDLVSTLSKKTKRARKTQVETRLLRAQDAKAEADAELSCCQERIRAARATLAATPNGRELAADLSDAAFFEAVRQW